MDSKMPPAGGLPHHQGQTFAVRPWWCVPGRKQDAQLLRRVSETTTRAGEITASATRTPGYVRGVGAQSGNCSFLGTTVYMHARKGGAS